MLLIGACAGDGGDDDDGAAAAMGASVEVVQVIDGDTLEVAIDGATERVRLIGINTPERDECLYDEATRALEDLVDGRPVRLEADRSDRDQYGRLLRYVFVGHVFVNEALVADGFAISRPYPPDTERQHRLDRAQAEAQEAERGQWAPDACGRPVAGGPGLAIVRIDHDPPGDDTLVLDEELVVIANTGEEPIALDGWTLRDTSASHRFTFPDLSLAPGDEVIVHSGCGAAGANDLYWCVEGSAVWNNDGDTAFLVDPAGNVVTSRSYE